MKKLMTADAARAKCMEHDKAWLASDKNCIRILEMMSVSIRDRAEHGYHYAEFNLSDECIADELVKLIVGQLVGNGFAVVYTNDRQFKVKW